MDFAKFIVISLGVMVVVGTLVSPELRVYGTQLLALLLLFYLVLQRLGKRSKRKEAVRRVEDEETLLFLSTYLKPKLTDLIDLTSHEENLEIIRKHLQLTEREVSDFLERKEKESEDEE